MARIGGRGASAETCGVKMKRDVSGKYLSKGEVALRLGVCVETVTHLMRKKKIPYYKLTNKLVLFKESDLEEAMKRHRVGA